MTSVPHDPEAGSGSVLALAVAGVVLATCLLLLPLGAALVARERAAAAADAAALAAADAVAGLRPGVPCEEAAALASGNGARLGDCGVDGALATVSVSVTAVAVVPGIRWSITATATAGPPDEVETTSGNR
ncbi:MAG: hypothetical protein H7146_09365 [Burkholderiaceae bacterium]|nr:hypothetical protein [Microbacteriaceae bacterium]